MPSYVDMQMQEVNSDLWPRLPDNVVGKLNTFSHQLNYALRTEIEIPDFLIY